LEHLYNVGVSEWISKELNKSFLNKYPIITICNGIDTDVFKPRLDCSDKIREKYNLGNGNILLGVATAWGERKGLSDYYKLREQLSEDYTIVLVGVPQSLQESLPTGIVGIQRTDSIEELSKLYSTASIVLNLASAESFGKTTPEGLACGVPSIVYNCTASPDLVDSETGVVVEKGDINGIVNAINTILTWDKETTIQKCRERACEHYSIKNNWPKYIELYKHILSKKE
jgi:glycosyltransferase involved in cell wall biosynthesis